MIQKRTVFVLGAGANVPYGFSNGEQLLEKARNLSSGQICSLVGDTRVSSQHDAMGQALSDNFLPSIDLMLEHREDLRPVGKKLMAALLFNEEMEALLNKKPISDDWMSLVLTHMSEGCRSIEEFGKNPVNFVTFNYDRFFEHRIIRGLVARYHVDPNDAWTALKQIAFVHVHGSLGILSEQRKNPPPATYGDAIPLGAQSNSDTNFRGLALSQIEKNVRIVHDKQDPHAFELAKLLLRDATQVVFLGFAFGLENVDRLDIPGNVNPNIRLCCTTFGMTAAELQDRVTPAFPHRPVESYAFNVQSKQLLREQISLFR